MEFLPVKYANVYVVCPGVYNTNSNTNIFLDSNNLQLEYMNSSSTLAEVIVGKFLGFLAFPEKIRTYFGLTED